MTETNTHIRPVRAEANAKRYGHMLQVRRLNRSLLTETASNLSYFALAGGYYYLTQIVPDLQHAFAGAVGVTLAVLYKKSKERYRISELDRTTEEYDRTERSESYDPVGLTFLGNRPLNTEGGHTEFHIFHDPTPIVSSLGLALHSTWQDVVMRPKSLVTDWIKSRMSYSPSSQIPDTDFDYGLDECCADQGVVMYTRLPHINNDAIVKMPASEQRLETSLSYTKSSIYPRNLVSFSSWSKTWKGIKESWYSDYTELVINLGGAVGAAEFCWSVGKTAVHTGFQGYETSDPTMLAFAAASAFTAYIGTDPLQSFLDDAPRINKKLDAKFAIVKVKSDAIRRVRATVDDIQDELIRCSYVDVGKETGNIGEIKNHIGYLTKRVDVSRLPPVICEHMTHRGIDVFERAPA